MLDQEIGVLIRSSYTNNDSILIFDEAEEKGQPLDSRFVRKLERSSWNNLENFVARVCPIP